MRALFHPKSLYILASYVLLSAIPFVPLLFGRPVEGGLQIVAVEFVCWIVLWSLFKHPRWFHWLSLPAFLILPVEVYLQTYYGQGLSTHHLGILAETSPKETAEFLGYKLWLLAGILFTMIGWWAFVQRCANGAPDLNWADRSRWGILFSFFAATVFANYGWHVGYASPAHASTDALPSISAPPSPSMPSETPSELRNTELFARLPKLPAWAALEFDEALLAKAWPFGLIIHFRDFWRERTYLADLKMKSGNFTFGAKQTNIYDRPQIVVMVIGESSRFDRWSINGYERDTNPLLRSEANLVSLSNVVSGVSATRLSVPVLVSRKSATQSLKAGFSEKSFLSAFREAGFKTYWLSNQMSFGQFDTPVSVFANEADVTQFLNLGGFTNQSNFDEVLLSPLKLAIADASKKKLIVLHTLGNHWNYSHRYPQTFDHWKPSLFGVSNPAYTDLALKADINNSYDNSILYTDWFLSEVIRTLKASDQISTMMYVADHGQTLYDGECNLAFHGHNTQYEFHVPAFVWYSTLYETSFPEKIQYLKANKNAPLSTENMFHSLLDMSSIHYAGERLDWSFVSKKLKRHKRYVDSYGWSDYDNSTFKGDCREVIDRNKPLAQER